MSVEGTHEIRIEATAVATPQPTTVAEAFLALLASRGVEYLFFNAGTDFAPISEAYARGARQGLPAPQSVLVPHENGAVAMAHGYTMVTGRPQAVMVHVGPGTANALNGIFNAARQNVPMLVAAGRTPILESGALGARNLTIHWAQEQFDQAGMLREFVKWDYELRHPAQIETVVDRALAIAASPPRGPVYLTLPREVIAAPFGDRPLAARATLAAASPPAPAPSELDDAAQLLARARSPLLITSNAGRTVAAARALTQFAEALAIPVLHHPPRYLAIPTEHPMHAGFDPNPLLGTADVVVVVDCDVPWIPAETGLAPEATVIHVGVDPLFARYPVRGFRADVALLGSLELTLPQLEERVASYASSSQVSERRERVTRESAVRRARGRHGFARGAAAGSITGRSLTAALNQVLDDDTILLNEYPLVLEELELSEFGQFFMYAASGGLGWGLGAALGAKLARPEATVVCAIGDGAYIFGNPTAAHFVSEAYGLPVLYVVFNNARWAAVHEGTLSLYPDGHAAQADEPPLATLEPSPRFEHVIAASGGYGERVTDASELIPALVRGLRAVREEGRQALLDVSIQEF